MRIPNYKQSRTGIGDSLTRALISVTITVFNIWGKSKKKRR